MASIKMVMALSLIFLLSHTVHSQLYCSTMSFSNFKTFDNCLNLPTLDAVFHWTYNAPKSTLSMAFTAPSKDGWVAWALNPTGSGMVGAQALMGFKPKSTGPISVNTADISSYHSIKFGTISYNVSELSSEESFGMITIFGTWVLPNGESKVNMVWQVGPVSDGKPDVHAMEVDNFSSKQFIHLSNEVGFGSSSGPAAAPWSIESAKSNGVLRGVISIFSVLGGLLVSLL